MVLVRDADVFHQAVGVIPSDRWRVTVPHQFTENNGPQLSLDSWRPERVSVRRKERKSPRLGIILLVHQIASLIAVAGAQTGFTQYLGTQHMRVPDYVLAAIKQGR